MTSATQSLESNNAGHGAVALWDRLQGARWISSARLLPAWILPALLGLRLKWYTMTSLAGFARVGRSIGSDSLTLPEKLSLFRADIVVGFLVIPLALLVINRFLSPRLGAIFTTVVTGSSLVLLALQARALDEVGRYISLNMMWIALGWGLHEPGANAGYLSGKSMLAGLAALVIIGIVMAWGVKNARRHHSERARRALRISAEVYLLVVTVIVAAGWKTAVPITPYHESSIVRAAVSLWKENAVETGEFGGFDFERTRGLRMESLPSMSSTEMISRYRELVHAPVLQADARYFRRESGDNVLFFIMETTPDEFLPADDDLTQFPNLARLRAKSFVGTRHYTTLPVTSAALFSVFSSWYPIDSMSGVWGFPSGEAAPSFLPRLNAEGYETAAFSPLRYVAEQDESMYRAVGFRGSYIPDGGLRSYEGHPSWRADRIPADVATLHLLELNLDRWIKVRKKFAAAFLPQIGHFPYADSYPPDSTENVRERGRAVIGMEDAWLGELMDFLQKRGQLDKTVIVILGDHGRRSRRENPNLRRGTIDETAFHVPLLIYAPRALNHTEDISWVTSHIDVAPTVLDLLGIRGGRDSEQGAAIWNPEMAGRTTFLLSQPTFGADGYASQGKFYMWNYFSDSVYANSQALFDMPDFVPRNSPTALKVTSNIATMAALEKAWHTHFARPSPPAE